MNIISLSGGQSSAYMLYLLLQDGIINNSNALIMFADTGLEHKKTYEFLDEIQKNWLNDAKMQIIYVKYKLTFEELIIKFGYPPNRVARYCTSRLKEYAIRDYCKLNNIKINNTYIGIRYDELDRKRDGFIYPLIERKIILKDVDDFFSKNNFKLEIPRYKGNCVGCFLKSLNKLIKIAQEEPEYLEFFVKMEKLTGQKFRSDYSYEKILQIARDRNRQLELFDDNRSINCLCTD